MGRRARNDWGSVGNKMEQEKENKNGGSFNSELYSVLPTPEVPHKSVLRFLPSPDTDMPYVETLTHYIPTDDGTKLVVNCPKTIGEKCPICDAQSALWKAGREDTYRERKKSSSWYANVLVLEDNKNPDNEGKVFVLRFGYKIKKMIDKLIEEEGTPAVVFDYDEGTDFKYEVKKQGEFNNYDDCGFKRKSSALDEDVADSADEQLHELSKWVSPDKIKSYDEIAKEYYDRTGDAPQAWLRQNASQAPVSAPAEAPASAPASAPAPVVESTGEIEDDFFGGLEDD